MFEWIAFIIGFSLFIVTMCIVNDKDRGQGNDE